MSSAFCLPSGRIKFVCTRVRRSQDTCADETERGINGPTHQPERTLSRQSGVGGVRGVAQNGIPVKERRLQKRLSRPSFSHFSSILYKKMAHFSSEMLLETK